MVVMHIRLLMVVVSVAVLATGPAGSSPRSRAAGAGGTEGFAVGQEQPSRSLFRRRAVSAAPARRASDLLERDARVAGYRVVDVDFDALGGASFDPAQERAEFAAQVQIELFGGLGGRALRDRVDLLRDGYAWVGHLDGEPLSNVALVVRNGVLSGTINAASGTYEINAVGGDAGGAHYIAQVQAPSGPSTELPPIPVAAPRGAGIEGDLAAQPDAATSVDLLVVYTPAARSAAGSKAAIEGAITTGNTNLNTALANSGVASTVNLVHMEEIPYTQSGNGINDLVAMQAGTGVLERAHLLRDAYAADVVTMVVDYNPFSFCGVAYLMGGPPSTAFAPEAFAVTNRGCISGHTFAHEIGHNWGNNHAPADPTGPGSFTYSFGFKEPAGLFRTVMAYPCPSGACPRVLYFSSPSPDVTYGGKPTGNAGPCVPVVGGCTAQNNAMSMTDSRSAVANFRTALTTAPPAPTISAPDGSSLNTTPTYTWSHVAAAAWYYLWVEGPTGDGVVIQQWYNAAEICTAGSCSVTPSTPLFFGVNSAWVRGWNTVGNGPWSARKDFTVIAPTAPGAATLTAPTGGITDTMPTYTWSAVSADRPPGDAVIAGDAATWYYLWVDGPDGEVIKQWYTAAGAGCAGGGTCAVTPSTTLVEGAHSWWVRTWNAVGFGPWSSRADFTVASSTPPAATLTSPTGDIADSTPTYRWNAVPGSTWYYLWVDGPGGNVIKQWYSAQGAGCGAGTGTCSVTPATPLVLDDHAWWIRTWNPLGYGPWSLRRDFRVVPP